MILYNNNHGAVGFANNWSVSGRTRHIDTNKNYIRELKERGLVEVRYRQGTELVVDNGTKNNQPGFFNYQTTDQFMTYPENDDEKKSK